MDKALPTPKAISCPSRERPRRIKHQLCWSFLWIALVTLGVGVALSLEPSNSSAWKGGLRPEEASLFYTTLRWRIGLGIGLIISVSGLVFGFLVRSIANPLAKSDLAAQRMADGHLGATLPTTAPNEIGRIGENINGLAVNFQEVLTLVWNQTEAAMDRLRRSTRPPQKNPDVGLPTEMMTELTSAQQELETMRMMVRSFDLYDVAIAPNDQLAAKTATDKGL